jgi:hypothetical protein
MSNESTTSSVQNETKSQISRKQAVIEKCFEVYYKLGPERSLLTVEKKSKIPLNILQQWCERYAWDEKILERNKDLDRVIEESYRSRSREIRNRLVNQMQRLMDDMENCTLGLPFAITSVGDLKQLSQAYESLVRANILATTKAQDLLAGGTSPKTWADLLGYADGDRPDEPPAP